MAHLLIYTDDPITDGEWSQILGLQLISGLTELLNMLRSNGNQAIPVGELPDFFRSSHIELLNAQFSKLKLPYRVANAGNQPWNVVLPYEKRSLKLYRVQRRPKKEAPAKRKGPPRCPPIFFNPDRNRPSDREGIIRLEIIGVKGKDRPWNSTQMNIKGCISISPTGGGFIHILPTRKEVDKIIGYLREMRELIPEE